MNGTTPSQAHSSPAIPDRVLVARVLGGERGAFEWIMRRYNQRIYRLVRSILHQEQDVLDTMQDAYIKGFRRLQQFKGPDGLGAWLCRIARNETLTRLRKAQPVAAQDYIDMAEQPDHFQGFMQPLDRASQQQLRGLLERAVDQLPQGKTPAADPARRPYRGGQPAVARVRRPALRRNGIPGPEPRGRRWTGNASDRLPGGLRCDLGEFRQRLADAIHDSARPAI